MKNRIVLFGHEIMFTPITRQVLLYGVVGAVQLLSDWILFVAFTSSGVSVILSNVLGRVGGAALGFWLNGKYTFLVVGKPAALGQTQMLKFIAAWILMSVLSSFAVWSMDGIGGLSLAWVGKPVIDAFLAIMGFFISKYWIYR